MINIVSINQARAFARQDGAILGIVWIVSFVCTMKGIEPEYALLGIVANILLLSTPFVVANRLKKFRDDALDGIISFRRALYYNLQTFFNATLLLTIVQYLWFSYMDMGSFMSLLSTQYTAILQEAYHISAKEAQLMIDTLLSMKPLAWASTFMITDLVVGAILSPIIAAIMQRKIRISNHIPTNDPSIQQ